MTTAPMMEMFEAVQARAARAYELARARRALQSALWVLPLVVVALALAERPFEVSLLALAMMASVWLADWRGKEWGRALPAGLGGGLLTFGAAISARWVMGDCCASGAGCSDWCIPACATAGGLAGLLTVLDAGRAANPLPRIATSASLSAMGGAMGCACIGYAGAGAMLIAMSLVLLPGGIWLIRRPLGAEPAA
jgi:hypothetical protein